ncbi:MAG TPA: phytanoyl-CoA dioxygenase family protein [Planctomycetota bacterium]|nr:phytanoyl-CoA dioxygenase family protein [Planctomycetota bacterium]
MPATAAALETCPAQLTREHLERYEADGCLAFDAFLTPYEVGSLQSAMREIITELHGRARSGELKMERSNWDALRNYSGYKIEVPGTQYGVLMEPDIEMKIDTVTIDEIDASYRKLAHPSRGHVAFKGLAEHPRLVAMLDALIGQGAILYGDMALCKPPLIGSPKPWHQDSAYFAYAPYGAGVDVWIALDDASVENGCMFVIPGAHKLGPKKHVHGDDCMVADGRYDYSKAVPVEMKAGGILLFSPMLPHYTPPNRSELRRRAAQIFYRAAHTRLISGEEHEAQFVEADGTPATCSAAKKTRMPG